MVDMVTSIRNHIEADDAEVQLARYLESYLGAAFETFCGRGDAEDVVNCFTAQDVVALRTLSVSISGLGAVALLQTRAKELNELLEAVPSEVELHRATDADLEPLWPLQRQLDTVPGIGHVVRSKLLARKRPKLVPIRDQHVLMALIGRRSGPLTLPLRDALRADGVISRLMEIRENTGAAHMSLLRILDVVVWMRTYGAARASKP